MATDYSYFDNLDGSDDIGPVPSWLDIQTNETDPTFGTNTNWDSSGLSEVGSRESEQVIYGSYAGTNENDYESDPRPRGQGRTVNAENSRERERLIRARFDNARLLGQSARQHAPSDAARRVTEQNKKALNEAIRRWEQQQRGTGSSTNNSGVRGETDGRNVTIPSDTGVRVKPIDIRPLPSPEFSGCEFEGILNKLYLAADGSWIVQLKVSYETKSEASKLDQTPGMALKIKVEQV